MLKICVLLVVGLMSSLANAENFIPNASFEETITREDGRTVPANWSFPEMDRQDVQFKATLASSSAKPLTGAKCLAMDESDAARCVAQVQLMLPNEAAWYRLTAWVRTDQESYIRAQVDAIGPVRYDARLDANDVLWMKATYHRSQSDAIYVRSEWRKITHLFKTIPADAGTKTTIRLIGWVEPGRIFWDDVSLERVEMQDPQAREPSVLPGIEDRPELRSSSPTRPGDVFVERPTHQSLGFQWAVKGDINRNGVVEMRYRKASDAEWRAAMPMLRIRHEIVDQGEYGEHVGSYVCPNMHAGSILNLEPGTEYEVEMTLKDPEGENSTRTVRVATRPLPKVYEGGRQLHVYPPEFSGTKQEPAYTGLRAAYAEVRPGDVILVHAGEYVIPEADEIERCSYVLNKKGTLEKPIVIRAAGDGEAVFSGSSNTIFEMTGGDYNWIDGLTFKDADCHIRSRGSTGLVVTRCRMEDSKFGVFAVERTCLDYTISDNVMIGSTDSGRQGHNSPDGGHAVWLAGQGHAVFNNLIHDWWDGIDIIGYYPPENPALRNCSIDFYRNHLYNFKDDCIELDYGSHNIRAFENLCYNAHTGITTQPLYGGPAYIYRNVVFNTEEPAFKFNNWPAGLLVYHNTLLSGFCSESIFQNSRVMNNLITGAGEERNGGLFTGTPTPETTVIDYNGYRKQLMLWNISRSYMNDTSGYANLTFETLGKLTKTTGYEAHGVDELDYDIFVNADRAWFASLKVFQPVDVSHFDVRLKDGNKAVDAGVVLPTINDGFSGKAPDLGAYEVGSEPIHYGPRPR